MLSGLDVPGLQQLLRCFAPAKRSFARGEILLLAGYENREIGILLEGQIEAVKTPADGTSVSITHMGPGGIFGDVLSGSIRGSDDMAYKPSSDETGSLHGRGQGRSTISVVGRNSSDGNFI